MSMNDPTGGFGGGIPPQPNLSGAYATSSEPTEDSDLSGETGRKGNRRDWYRRWRSKAGKEPGVQSNARKSIVVAVAAPKDGVGKTTLTINLAAFAAERLQSQGKRVAVIDANYHHADIGRLLGRYEPTLENVAQDPEYQTASQIQRFMCTTHFMSTPPLRSCEVDVLLGPNPPQEYNPEWVTPQLYNTVTDACRELYDVIFVDCPVADANHELFKEFILPQADYLLMPITPSFAMLMNAKSWLNYFVGGRTSGEVYDADKVGIILNQAQENVDVDSETLRLELSRWKFLAELKFHREWIRAANKGMTGTMGHFHEVEAAFTQVMWDITKCDVFNPKSGRYT